MSKRKGQASLYRALVRVWHSKDSRHYEAGEVVDLGHLDAARIAALMLAGVMSPEPGTVPPALALEAAGVPRALAVRLGMKYQVHTLEDLLLKTAAWLAGTLSVSLEEAQGWIEAAAEREAVKAREGSDGADSA